MYPLLPHFGRDKPESLGKWTVLKFCTWLLNQKPTCQNQDEEESRKELDIKKNFLQDIIIRPKSGELLRRYGH
jgi:hypothetical protein